jgi:phosphoribosyl-AMP cyclohydrolase / phosphoribosyl-ATP pyrophosphohydrolase
MSATAATGLADEAFIQALRFDAATGLIPMVAQHAHSGEVLMVAYADRAALARTFRDGVMWYWSRSRGRLWKKGESSGNVQQVLSLHADCDADAVVARVLPAGPTCHTGTRSCFDAAPTLAALDSVLEQRAADPAAVGYTARLLADPNLRLKKLGEEAVELALACERGTAADVRAEAADLLYHVLVACRGAGVSAGEVLGVLEQRRHAHVPPAAETTAAADTANAMDAADGRAAPEVRLRVSAEDVARAGDGTESAE